MISAAAALFAAVAWLALAALIDRRNARREGVVAVSLTDVGIVLAVSVCAVLAAPAAERLGVGIAVTGLGVAAFGDLRNGYLWEELTVPTLLAVLGAAALSGIAQNAVIGTAVLGAIALAVYLAGRIARQDPGFGDIVPTAVIGAAFGPLVGVGAFAIACGLFGIGAAVFQKRRGTLFPFGPAIVAALLIGAAGSSLISTSAIRSPGNKSNRSLVPDASSMTCSAFACATARRPGRTFGRTLMIRNAASKNRTSMLNLMPTV